MSPELSCSDEIDQRSDLYQLGATYYMLLTGVKPYVEAVSVVEVMQAHCELPVPDPRSVNPRIPDDCAEIVARAMQKDPHARYQTAEQMLQDLLAVGTGLQLSTPTNDESVVEEDCAKKPRSARPPGSVTRFGAVLAALLAVALALLLLLLGTFHNSPRNSTKFDPAQVFADLEAREFRDAPRYVAPGEKG